MTTGAGPLHGPSYGYRGAVLDGNAGGTLFRITMPGTAIDGWKGLCPLDLVCALVDSYLMIQPPEE